MSIIARMFAMSLFVLPGLVWAQERVPANGVEMQLSFAPVVARSAPAVVSVFATFASPQGGPYANDPLFFEFFRGFGTAPKNQNALGSGVLVGDGLLITNYHVVRDAQKIRVVLADRREFSAREVLSDMQSDLVVLHLQGADPQTLPALEIGDSDALAVGDLVLAIGNPFGIGLSVSSGIISGLARRSSSTQENGNFFLQTDAPINPGNSGGALVNMRGQLVGINTLIVTRSGGSMGLGFATPSNLVRQVVEQARAGKSRFERPWLGLEVQAIDADLAEALGMDRPQGLLLRSLMSESPFAKAGLVAGDVLLTLGGQAVNSRAGLEFRMSSEPLGKQVAITWLRNSIKHTALVDLIVRPANAATADSVPVTITVPGPFQNRTLVMLTPEIARRLGLRQSAKGVVVIKGPGPSMMPGVVPGDIIIAVDGVPITSPEQIAEMAQEHGTWWRIDLIRGNRTITFGTNH